MRRVCVHFFFGECVAVCRIVLQCMLECVKPRDPGNHEACVCSCVCRFSAVSTQTS